jgi:hypothetical protein
MDVEGVPVHPELVQQVGGQPGQRVEGVPEFIRSWCVGQAEAEVVGCDDVIPIGQRRDQVAEHERAGREAVQQQQGRRLCRARLPEEQPAAVHGGISMVDGCHFCSLQG